MFSRRTSRRLSILSAGALFLLLLFVTATDGPQRLLAQGQTQAQTPAPQLNAGRNVNMVAGTTWPDGDPYLQRQNEPSVAASTRNPLHLLAGANDYRTVDIPFVDGAGETGDAWLGTFKSFDGGQRWRTSLLPGYPQDISPVGVASPLHGYDAGADPVVRPGTSGLLYYAGIVFNRSANGKSAVFVARFIDNNNKENGDPIAYLGASIVAKDAGAKGAFIDKPWIASDIPRQAGRTCRIPDQTGKLQRVPAGDLYLTYSVISGSTAAGNFRSTIMFASSSDCGTSWSKPVAISASADPVNQGATIAVDPRNGTVNVAWRVFGQNGQPDAVMIARSAGGNRPFQNLKRVRQLVADHSDRDVEDWVKDEQEERREKRGGDPDDRVGKHAEDRGDRDDDKGHGDDEGNKKSRERNRQKSKTLLAEAAGVAGSFDQATSGVNGELSFRTNAYPTMTVDGNGRVYLAWTERGYAGLQPEDARIVISSSTDGVTWTPRQVVEEPKTASGQPLAGHQLMPTLAFGGGRLVLAFYDLRDDVSETFGQWVNDQSLTNCRINAATGLTECDIVRPAKRHTLDLRAAYGTPGPTPVFDPSVRVSDYLVGFQQQVTSSAYIKLVPCTPGGPPRCRQLQYNAPNLPMFKQGTAPFMGDYIDLAVAPAFVPTANGQWTYNLYSSQPVFHAVWTDNRDVRQPPAGANGRPDWTKYTPPVANQAGASRFDPTQNRPTCDSFATGSRNQNIYTARLSTGLVVGSPGNTKPLSSTLQRSFVVFAQNTTSATKYFRMQIASQPPSGTASFSQFNLSTTWVDVTTPPRSMASRTVYVTSSFSNAQLKVNVTEIASVPPPAIPPVIPPGALSDTIILNPDIANPDIANPDIANPDIANPDIANAEVHNPDIANPDIANPDIANPDIANARISNPDIANPDIANPDIANPDIANPDIANPDIANMLVANPDIANPDIANPDIANPDIANPDIANPDIANPDIANAPITDVTWTITNTGNTTSAFNVNLFLAQQTSKICAAGQSPTSTPGGCIATQLILRKVYGTPTAVTCWEPNQPAQVGQQNVLVASIPNPTFLTQGSSTLPDQNDPSASNATLWLAPGETGKITLRIADPNKSDNVQPPNGATATPGATVDPIFFPTTSEEGGAVTPVLTSQGVGTEAAAAGATKPPVVTPQTPDGAPASTPTASSIFFLQPPTNTAVFAPQAVSVQVRDQFGAVMNNLPVALTLVGPAATLTGGGLANTDANGVATFSGVSINQVASGYALQASVPSTSASTLSPPFTVTKASATVTVPSATVTYTGSAQSVTPTTTPAGLALTTTYNGGVAPIAVGSYAVLATVNDANYEGTGSGTLTITKASAIVNLDVGDLAQVDNATRPVDVTTVPPGLAAAVTVTYNGSPTPPSAAGSYAVLATVNDLNYEGSAAGTLIIIPACDPLVVTSTGDTTNCGSLRAAIIYANAHPGSTIAFNILGASSAAPADIAVTSPLPNITEGLTIDGGSQPGYNVAVGPAIEVSAGSSGASYGLSVFAGSTTVRGLAITGFQGAGVWVFQNISGVTIEHNTIGTDAAGSPGKGNGEGVQFRYISNAFVQDNVIAGNSRSGVLIEGGENITVHRNQIGMVAGSTLPLANGGSGVTAYYNALNTSIHDNMISGNATWGIDLQYGNNEQVTGTIILNNTIGLDASGNAAPNFAGGVRLDQAPGTIVGAPPATEGQPSRGNVISGNGGHAILVLGDGSGVTIQANKIGTNPAGDFARPNGPIGGDDAAVMIYDGVSGVLIGGDATLGEGNLISGNSAYGIKIWGTENSVFGNLIGTNAAGTAALPNTKYGIHVEIGPNNVIGGSQQGQRNVIAGNGSSGIALTGQGAYAGAIGTQITGNDIGLNAAGTGTIPNAGAGVDIREGASGNITGNTISGNAGAGVAVWQGAIGTTISGNSIFANGGLGIAVASPGIAAAPVLTNVTTAGFHYSVPDSVGGYTIEVFTSSTCDPSGFGEGQVPLDTFSGPTSDTVEMSLPLGSVVTVTATNGAGTTEFSNCATVAAPTEVTVVLGNLSQVYDGSPKPVSVTPTPAAAYSVTYNGSETVPSATGSYAVVATVTQAGYTGSASGTLVISAAPTTAGITITGASSIYDGTPKPVTVVTTPAPGLSYTATYNGNSTVPSAIGAYFVSATINEPGYTPTSTTAIHKIASTMAAGGFGGGPYAVGCSPGTLATGFSTYNASSYGLLNARLECSAGGPSAKFNVNDPGTPNQSAMCPSGQVMVGFAGYLDDGTYSGHVGATFVRSFGPRCQSPSGGSITTVAPTPAGYSSYGPAFGSSDQTRGSFDCPAGQAVVSVVGGAGSVIDSVALVCAPLAPVDPVTIGLVDLGIPTLMGGAISVPGLSGQAISFSPSAGAPNQYARFADQPGLVMTNAVTMSAWINPTGPGFYSSYYTSPNDSTQMGEGGMILNKENSYEVARFADGSIRWAFWSAGPGWTWINSFAVAPEGQWTHVAVTYDAGAGVAHTYLNGALAYSYPVSGAITSAGGQLRIGGRQSTDTNFIYQNFQGVIDGVRLFNRALTAAEVLALAGQYDPGSRP